MDVIHIVYIYIPIIYKRANILGKLCAVSLFFYIRVIIISCVYKNMYTGGSNDRFDRT